MDICTVRSSHEYTVLQNLLRQAGMICITHWADCNQCDCAQRCACTTRAVETTVDTLMQMVENFRHEESLLRQVASTGQIHPHVRAHADISMRMSLAIDAYADNNTAMFLHRLTETLQVWLKHHLVKSDLPLAEPSLQTAHSASLNT